MRCAHCKQEVATGAESCGNCGLPTAGDETLETSSEAPTVHDVGLIGVALVRLAGGRLLRVALAGSLLMVALWTVWWGIMSSEHRYLGTAWLVAQFLLVPPVTAAMLLGCLAQTEHPLPRQPGDLLRFGLNRVQGAATLSLLLAAGWLTARVLLSPALAMVALLSTSRWWLLAWPAAILERHGLRAALQHSWRSTGRLGPFWLVLALLVAGGVNFCVDQQSGAFSRFYWLVDSFESRSGQLYLWHCLLPLLASWLALAGCLTLCFAAERALQPPNPDPESPF